MNATGWCYYLGIHTVWEFNYEVLIDSFEQYIILFYTVQSCMQWEDVTVWTRLEAQIDSAARLMKIYSEHAERQCSI